MELEKQKLKAPDLQGGFNDYELIQNKPLSEQIDNIKLYSRIKKTTSTVPTKTPNNFFEMFEFYSSGATNRLYVWCNNTWKYVNLS